MNGVNSLILELEERKIGLKGEEFYALVVAYINKINDLMQKPKADSGLLLTKAKSYEVTQGEEDKTALKKEFKRFLKKQGEGVTALCGDGESEQTIQNLHSFAVVLGCKRDYLETVKRCRDFANTNDLLNSEKDSYQISRDSYESISRIKYNDKALEKLINMRAGKVKTSLETLKKEAKGNLEAMEGDFFKRQIAFFGKVASFLVDDECRFIKQAGGVETSMPVEERVS